MSETENDPGPGGQKESGQGGQKESGQGGQKESGPSGQKESGQGGLEKRRARRRAVARGTDLSTIGLVFPVAMVLGFLAGRAIGGIFGGSESGGLIGGAFGLVAGFYNVYRTASTLAAQDESGPDSDDPG